MGRSTAAPSSSLDPHRPTWSAAPPCTAVCPLSCCVGAAFKASARACVAACRSTRSTASSPKLGYVCQPLRSSLPRCLNPRVRLLPLSESWLMTCRGIKRKKKTEGDSRRVNKGEGERMRRHKLPRLAYNFFVAFQIRRRASASARTQATLPRRAGPTASSRRACAMLHYPPAPRLLTVWPRAL